MKPLYTLILCLLFVSPTIFSQEDPIAKGGAYLKFSIATSLRVNEDYRLRLFRDETEADHNDECETLIQTSVFFINTSIGYQFENRAALGVNLEYNYHSREGLHFLPTYLSARLNIVNKPSSAFIRGGYGTLFNLSNNFQKGSVYKVGLGFILDNSILFGLDFTNKSFGYRSLDELSTVSIFFEYMVL